MKKFLHETDGFYSNKINYQDRDSLDLHMDRYKKVEGAGYVGKNLGQARIDHGDKAGIFYGLFLAPKMKLLYIRQIWNTWKEVDFWRIS